MEEKFDLTTLELDNEVKEIIHFIDPEGTENRKFIKVKQYLPIDKKLEMISKVISNCFQDGKYVNYGKYKVYAGIELLKYYTNIDFDSIGLEDNELYDYIAVNKELFVPIQKLIPESEIDFITTIAEGTIESYQQYLNSAVGVLDVISQDYDNLNFDADKIKEKISNPEDLALLKDVLDKLE